MSIRVGDHLVIKRDEKIITPEDEGYHEFEVMTQPIWKPAPDSKYSFKTGYLVDIEVVK